MFFKPIILKDGNSYYVTKDSLVKQVRELLGQVKQKGFLQYRAAWDLSF